MFWLHGKNNTLYYVYDYINSTFVLLLENKTEFIEKYLKAKVFVKLNTVSQPILSIPGLNRIAVGNWILISKKDCELSIQNSDGLQVYIFFGYLSIKELF